MKSDSRMIAKYNRMKLHNNDIGNLSTYRNEN